MRTSLGLSVGSTQLIAVGNGAPTVRRATLTLFGHRPPEVGVPSEFSQNPRLDEAGLVVSGFVDRVGDPVPIVASDGSTHRGERLLAEALEALTRAASPQRRPEHTAVAVRAHWRPAAVDALRRFMPHVRIVSDATAALTALRAQLGLPARGIVALCDFGATGTSVTLADSGGGFRPIGPTVRYDDFSGDLIDQAVLTHVLADLEVDPVGTSAVAALIRLRDQCRAAKERLSYETATGFSGPQSTVRLTRAELESLMHSPLDGLIAAVEDMLRRHNIHPAELVAVATAGGGARIPLVTERLSETLRVAVATTPNAPLLAATGAAIIAACAPEDEAATQLAEAPLAVSLNTAETMAAPAALAWSATDAEPVYDGGYCTDDARPEVHFLPDEFGAADPLPPLPWYRRPGVLFGAAACLAALATTGLVLTSGPGEAAVPAGSAGPAASSVAPPTVVEAPAPVPAAATAPPPQTVFVRPPAAPVSPQAPLRQAAAPAPAVPAPAAPPAVVAPAPAAPPPPAPAPTTETPIPPPPPSTSTSPPPPPSTSTSPPPPPTSTAPPPTVPSTSPPTTVPTTSPPRPSTPAPPPSSPPPSTNPPPSTGSGGSTEGPGGTTRTGSSTATAAPQCAPAHGASCG